MTRPVVTAAVTDSALVEAARSGDVASYGLLVERYQSIAHRTAFAMGAGDDTADVVQEAFVKVYLALDRFQVTQPFRPMAPAHRRQRDAKPVALDVASPDRAVAAGRR
jgi:RNA polymerase sigma-70 factor (ECF subfamily)